MFTLDYWILYGTFLGDCDSHTFFLTLISDIWGLLSYHEEAIKRRGEKIEKLCLRERQVKYSYVMFCSLN